MTVDGQKHVSRLKNTGRRPGGHYGANENPAAVVFQSEKFSLRRVLQLSISDPKVGVLVIVSAADVFQKSIDHRGGNHVGNALSYVAAISLERYANYFAILHHWPTAITRIDLRADLNRQMLID